MTHYQNKTFTKIAITNFREKLQKLSLIKLIIFEINNF